MAFQIEIDFLGEHSRDDLESGVVGVAPSLNESRGQTRSLHCLGDRLSAAVNDDRPHANCLHEHHVDQQGSKRLGVFHHGTPELDHRESAMKLSDITKRLDEDVRLADRFFMHGKIPLPHHPLARDDQTKSFAFHAGGCKEGGDSPPEGGEA